MLAAVKKHSNTSSVTLNLALSRGSSPNKPLLKRAREEDRMHVATIGNAAI